MMNILLAIGVIAAISCVTIGILTLFFAIFTLEDDFQKGVVITALIGWFILGAAVAILLT